MKKVLLAVSLIYLLAACAAKPSNYMARPESENVLFCYKEFLTGKINAQDGETEVSVNSLFMYDAEAQLAFNQYAIFDMNGDGIPELHVRSVSNYTIFTFTDGQITLWHSTVPYCYPLNNGAILFTRDGGAPKHTNYAYIICDYFGKEIYRIDFSEYDDEAGNAIYYYDDVELSKDDWQRLTERYFSIQSDQIEWKVYDESTGPTL